MNGIGKRDGGGLTGVVGSGGCGGGGRQKKVAGGTGSWISTFGNLLRLLKVMNFWFWMALLWIPMTFCFQAAVDQRDIHLIEA